MLVVVVVDDRDADGRRLQVIDEEVHGNAAAERGELDDRRARGVLDHAGDRARDGQVHPGARGRIARAPAQPHETRRLQPRVQVRRVGDERVTLLAEMVLQACADLLRGLVGDEPEVDGRRRFRRDGVCGAGADVAAGDPAQVQGRAHEGLEQALTRPFAAREAELAPDGRIHVGRRRDRAALGRGQRPDIVGKAGDQDAALGVAQAGDEARELGDGIRGPVAVVAAVQSAHRAVRRDLDLGDPARPEVDLHAACLVNGPVEEEPEVALQATGVRLEEPREVGRARFLLAFQEELQVDRKRERLRAHRVQGGKQRDDRRLVVARRAGVDPPLRLKLRSNGLPRDLAAPVFEGLVAQDRLPRLARPL